MYYPTPLPNPGADLEGGGGGVEGARGPRLSFFGFFYIIFVTNCLSSSGIVQSPQGCTCVVDMEYHHVLHSCQKVFGPLSEFSGSASAS